MPGPQSPSQLVVQTIWWTSCLIHCQYHECRNCKSTAAKDKRLCWCWSLVLVGLLQINWMTCGLSFCLQHGLFGVFLKRQVHTTLSASALWLSQSVLILHFNNYRLGSHCKAIPGFPSIWPWMVNRRLNFSFKILGYMLHFTGGIPYRHISLHTTCAS